MPSKQKPKLQKNSTPATDKRRSIRKQTKLPKSLRLSEVFKSCKVSELNFRSTKQLSPSHEIYAQDRAKKAINAGLGIRRPGYNIYVAGIEGTGKTSVIETFLERWSKNIPVPNDWVYLYNFSDQERPKAIKLEKGAGRKFKKRMEQLVRTLKSEVPSALQSEDYENAVNAYYSASNEAKSKLYSDLEKQAKAKDFIIKSTRVGIETIPVVEGRPVSEKDYSKLDDTERAKIEGKRSELEPEVLDFARKVRAIDKESRERVEELRDELGHQIITAIVSPLIDEYSDSPDIVSYLNDLMDDAKENLLDFAEEEALDGEEQQQIVHERDRFTKYKVNVFIDHTDTKTAPIVIENNPTYYNLFGKIEKNVEHGMYLTDFTMIKAGSLHRANGGYLVLNALDLFRAGNIWDTLKRVLRNRTGFIEDMGEQYSLLPTSGLRPDPIPLDLKVILIGTDDIYHLLFHEDEEFQKIFKIKADFDYKMDRNDKNIKNYVSFIATRTHRESLLPFDRSGVAAVVEQGSRMVEDQNLLSAQFGTIKDLTIEADYFARQRKSSVIKRVDVEEAVDQKYYRLNLQEESILKMVADGDIAVSIEGAVVGQINGLAVYDFGDIAFGKIGRITCTSSVGEGHIFNIERFSRLSGKFHDKGVAILSSLINHFFSRVQQHILNSSLCFEQSYGLVDGDSASTAELIAVISSMAEIPIDQSFAVTGAINQMGAVQAVGGINEKVEGFHKIAKMLGKGKVYNVVIPQANVRNLMLNRDVRESIQNGFLKIFPVQHIWEAFELVTGVPLGIVQTPVSADEIYASGSALAKIEERLRRIHKEHRAENEESESEG